jgi:hypothetical protein
MNKSGQCKIVKEFVEKKHALILPIVSNEDDTAIDVVSLNTFEHLHRGI